jgi:hypothetical protein
MLLAGPAAFVGMYAYFARREKPVADADAYAEVFRAHREACETLGGKFETRDELIRIYATVDRTSVSVRTKVGIGFIPKETFISCAAGAKQPSYARHHGRCDRKHAPRQRPEGDCPTSDAIERVPAVYCMGGGESVWAWRRGGERDAARLVAAVRGVAGLATAPPGPASA